MAQPTSQQAIERLASYNPSRHAWHTIPDDGYLYDHLAQELHAAGRDDALLALFRDDHWMHARFDQCNSSYCGFQRDLAFAWECVAHPRAAEDSAFMECIRLALIWAALNSLRSNNVPPIANPEMDSSVKMAWAAPNLIDVPLVMSEQASALEQVLDTVLSPQLPASSRQRGMGRALASAALLSDPGERARAIMRLGPQLPADMLPRALEGALRIHDLYYRAGTLSALAPYLTEDLLARVNQVGPLISERSLLQHFFSTIFQLVLIPLRSALQHLFGKPSTGTHDINRAAIADIVEHGGPEEFLTVTPYLTADRWVVAQELVLQNRYSRERAEELVFLLDKSRDQSAMLRCEIRRAIADYLLEQRAWSFDEIVVFCEDDVLFTPSVLGMKALSTIYSWIRELTWKWHWRYIRI